VKLGATVLLVSVPNPPVQQYKVATLHIADGLAVALTIGTLD